MTGVQPTLVLDIDGVLLDPTRGGLGSWKVSVSERFGVNADDLVATFFAPYWSEVVVGHLDIEPTIKNALTTLGWKVSVDELLAAWFDADFCPRQNVIEWVHEQSDRGIPVMLATNQEHHRATYLAQRFRPILPVHTFVYSAALGAAKPDPEFFRRAHGLMAHGAQRSDVVFLDDSEDNITAANEWGWTAVHFATSDNSLQAAERALAQIR
jgi:putative hydrolase of the HAD superfamily